MTVRDSDCDAVVETLRLPVPVTAAIVGVVVCDELDDVDADAEGEGVELGDAEAELDSLGLDDGRAESVAGDDAVALIVDE